MEIVHTLDIDGSQWEIQDVEARNKIVTLETKTTVKITKKIDQEKFKMNLVEINDEKFIQLHFNGILWNGVIGDILGSFNNDFGLKGVVRCMVGIDFSDGSGRDTLAFDIEPSGVIRAYPQTTNQTTGKYKASNVYGDAFIRVEY